MAQKLVVSENYVIVEVDGKEKETFASAKSYYTIANRTFVIKTEINGQVYKIPFSEVGEWLDGTNGDTPFTEETLLAFLQKYTGKGSASTGDTTNNFKDTLDVTSETLDGVYNQTEDIIGTGTAENPQYPVDKYVIIDGVISKFYKDVKEVSLYSDINETGTYYLNQIDENYQEGIYLRLSSGEIITEKTQEKIFCGSDGFRLKLLSVDGLYYNAYDDPIQFPNKPDLEQRRFCKLVWVNENTNNELIPINAINKGVVRFDIGGDAIGKSVFFNITNGSISIGMTNLNTNLYEYRHIGTMLENDKMYFNPSSLQVTSVFKQKIITENTSRNYTKEDNGAIIIVEDNITLTLVETLPPDFHCEVEVKGDFTLTNGVGANVTVSPLPNSVLKEDKMQTIFRYPNSNEFRIKGENS